MLIIALDMDKINAFVDFRYGKVTGQVVSHSLQLVIVGELHETVSTVCDI